MSVFRRLVEEKILLEPGTPVEFVYKNRIMFGNFMSWSASKLMKFTLTILIVTVYPHVCSPTAVGGAEDFIWRYFECRCRSNYLVVGRSSG